MATPLLSIIIPIYNASSAIPTLVEKILAQKMKDFELILVDDGSKDDSWEVIQALAKTDQRIVSARHQENKGQGEARNYGLHLARGTYIMFFDIDDDIHQNMIAAMTSKIQKGVDLVTCSMRFVWLESGKVEDVWTKPALARQATETIENYVIRLLGADGRLYSSVNKIFKADIIRKYKLKFLKRNFGEDTLFVLSYLKHANNLMFLTRPYYIYNKGTATSTMSKSSIQYANWQRNFRDVKDWANSQADQNWLDWLQYRWFVSYLLAVKRAKDFSLSEKRKIIKQANLPSRLAKIGNLKVIGFKKWAMELTIKSFILLFC